MIKHKVMTVVFKDTKNFPTINREIKAWTVLDGWLTFEWANEPRVTSINMTEILLFEEKTNETSTD